MSWTTPAPRWDTLAGRVLDSFFASVHERLPEYDGPLTVFGSAPIQLCLDESFASADVDLMVLEGTEELRCIAAVWTARRASCQKTGVRFKEYASSARAIPRWQSCSTISSHVNPVSALWRMAA